MKEIITLRQILNSKYPKGHRIVSKNNTNFIKSKPKR